MHHHYDPRRVHEHGEGPSCRSMQSRVRGARPRARGRAYWRWRDVKRQIGASTSTGMGHSSRFAFSARSRKSMENLDR